MEHNASGFSDSDLADLHARILANEASPVEAHQLRLWLEAHGVDMGKVRLPGDTTLLPEMPDIDTSASWLEIMERLTPETSIRPDRPGSSIPHPTSVIRRSFAPGERIDDERISMSETTGGVHRLTAKPRLPFGKYLFGKHLWTTAIAGVAGAILLWSGAQIASRPSALPREMRMTTYTTNHGERATITLADGSSVVLNVGSQLEVPSDYAQGNRALRLTGEALFTVTPDNEAPFTVSAGPGTARVLGTSFLVRHYPMDTAAIIAVRDGKVGVRTTILTANQQAIVTTNGTLRTQAVVPSQFSFAAGILTLNDVPLTAAISELNRWYNADIRLSDPVLSAQRISGEYAAGSLTDLAAILELTFNVRVAREGRTLTLYRRIE